MRRCGPLRDDRFNCAGRRRELSESRRDSCRPRLPFPAFRAGAPFLRRGLRGSVQSDRFLRRRGVLSRASNFSGGDFSRLLGRIELVRQLFQAGENVVLLLGQNAPEYAPLPRRCHDQQIDEVIETEGYLMVFK